ncbi:hypothetical protein AMAG_08722 [Allomyces macrogynus ATCC 38327]|uniref:CCHC-type domain-containing protein n=1 Tax=Allomyces macrogynus (strain ATCC 38327) TaxID=578462 RepID=A0A0L0SML1_ALLM3|nr:hypothetical protein AMAG_08722 [Allomyces macrogynus ATCC 38327]|eukprot:KNE63620.1 hypothetical protein AMAG_08722 [Allomyces macrogynus ATCC 38327]
MPADVPFLKLLFVGPINGDYDKFRDRFRKLFAANRFNYVFVTGQFFGTDAEATNKLLDQSPNLNFPIPVYLLPTETPFPPRVQQALLKASADGTLAKGPVKIAHNIYVLGTTGEWVSPEGLRVAFVGGTFDPTRYEAALDANEPHTYHASQLAALTRVKHTPVDVLVTYDVPQYMAAHALDGESPVIADVVLARQPRYHLAGGARVYYERAPFRNADARGNALHPTKFVALAPLGGADPKQRAFYGVNIIPIKHNSPGKLNVQPKDVTANPIVAAAEAVERELAALRERQLKLATKRTRSPADDGAVDAGGEGLDQPRAAKRVRDEALAPAPASDSIMAEAAASMAGKDKRGIAALPKRPDTAPGVLTDKVRDSTAKPLPDGYVCRICNVPGHWVRACPNKIKAAPPADCWFCLHSPGLAQHCIFSIGDKAYAAVARGPLVPHHVLVATVEHPDSLFDARDDVRAYLAGLRKFYAERDMVPVVFQIARPGLHVYHPHVQIVPVPVAQESAVLDGIVAALENQGYAFTVLNLIDGTEASEETTMRAAHSANRDRCSWRVSHFRMCVAGKLVYFAIPRDVKFPAGMPRQVIGAVLGEPERGLDWKSCVDEVKETQYATELREAFIAFKPAAGAKVEAAAAEPAAPADPVDDAGMAEA